MNYRQNNYGNSYMDTNNNKLGYSSVSKGYGYSNRSILFSYHLDYGGNDDQNFGEVEYMLEN